MECFRRFFCRNSIDCHSHVGRWFSSQYLYRSIPFESRCCAFTSNTRTSEQHFIWGVIKIHALLCAKHFFPPFARYRNNNNFPQFIFAKSEYELIIELHVSFWAVHRISHFTLLFFLEQERARHDISSKQNDTARWCAKHYGTFRISWVLAAMMAFWRPRDLIKFGNCFSLIVTEWMQKNIMGVN